MYFQASPANVLQISSLDNDLVSSPVFMELSKKTHFFRFLQKEINIVKTEAEKEAVLTILMKTKIQIRALEKEWKEMQRLEQSPRANSNKLHTFCPPHRLQ